MLIGSNNFVGAGEYIKGLVRQTAPAPLPAPKAAPAPAPAKTATSEAEAVRNWMNSFPGQTDVAKSVEQNPSGQGLVFRRRFQFTDVIHVEEGNLQSVKR